MKEKKIESKRIVSSPTTDGGYGPYCRSYDDQYTLFSISDTKHQNNISIHDANTHVNMLFDIFFIEYLHTYVPDRASFERHYYILVLDCGDFAFLIRRECNGKLFCR